MKRALRVIGILVALLIVIAVALPFLIDANQFRPRLEQELTKVLGRDVQLGDLKLSLFSGGVTASELSIADDPAFSKSPFLTAKSLSVGVELQPLIFSRKLNVTGIDIENPEIQLIQSKSGDWNFSNLGGQSAPSTTPPASSGATPEFSVKLVKISNGHYSLLRRGDRTPAVLEKVNFEATDFAPDKAFPFSLTGQVQGGGDINLTGKAGPIDQKNFSDTPFDAALKVNKLDFIHTGLVRESTGFGGLVSVDGTASYNGHVLSVKGNIKAENLKLAPKGKPASRVVAFDFLLDHDMDKHTGSLTRGDVHIGKASAELTGTYSLEETDTVVNLKFSAPAMQVDELVAMLPSLGVVLPNGSSLQGGTLTANLAVEGPTDKLLSSGSLAVKKTRLAGFDLGSRMTTIAKIAGLKISPDTDFDNVSMDVKNSPAGTDIQNIAINAPTVGDLTGAGTVDPANALAFKMHAKMHSSGGVLAVVGDNIPFSIQGTAADPKFVPDVKGMAADRLKSLAPPDTGKAAEGIINLFKKKKPQ